MAKQPGKHTTAIKPISILAGVHFSQTWKRGPGIILFDTYKYYQSNLEIRKLIDANSHTDIVTPSR